MRLPKTNLVQIKPEARCSGSWHLHLSQCRAVVEDWFQCCLSVRQKDHTAESRRPYRRTVWASRHLLVLLINIRPKLIL